MQIKIIMRYHYPLIRSVKIKNAVTISNIDKDAEKWNHWYTAGGNMKCKMIQSPGK